MKKTIIVSEVDSGRRVDVFLAEILMISRQDIQRHLKAGEIMLGTKTVKANYRILGTEIFTVEWEEKKEELPQAEELPLNVLYEDDEFIVINKARGQVVHPGPGNLNGTLVNALLYHTKGNLVGGEPERPGIVHRLDRDTSGVMVVAKTELAYLNLSEQIREHQAKREYLCLVHGLMETDRGIIKLPLGRDPHNRFRRAVQRESGKMAITHFEVREKMSKYSFLACRLETGRTHQIRVHLAYIGYPVVQDPLYGRRKDAFPIDGQVLHSYTLTLRHPLTAEEMTFTALLPEDFQACLAKAREDGI